MREHTVIYLNVRNFSISICFNNLCTPHINYCEHLLQKLIKTLAIFGFRIKTNDFNDDFKIFSPYKMELLLLFFLHFRHADIIIYLCVFGTCSCILNLSTCFFAIQRWDFQFFFLKKTDFQLIEIHVDAFSG